MVLDASALLAILFDEPERARMEQAIAADPLRLVSSVSKLAAALALIGRHGPDAPARLDRLLSEIGASVLAFDEAQAELAATAFALRPRPPSGVARLGGVRGLCAVDQRGGVAAVRGRGVGADGCGSGVTNHD